ncbi:MAG: rod shape-determining protein RodA [Rhodothermaceae bacterium]|nr:rod shape-determining protein RodA [Rhodothermaceae bacterium]
MRAWYKNLDWTIILLWAGLVSIGLTAIYSATHGPAREFLLLTVQQNFNRQAQWFVISGVAMLAILFTPARLIDRLTPIVYVITTLLLVAALVFGREVNGAKSWVYIGPFGLQVSELAKVGTLLLVSRFLALNQAREGRLGFLLIAAGIVLVPAALIVLQNDTGTALVFLALIPVLAFWTGTIPLSWLALSVGAAVAGYLYVFAGDPTKGLTWGILFGLGFTAVMLITTRSRAFAILSAIVVIGTVVGAWVALDKVLQPHQKARLVAFADPEAYRSTAGFHVIQSKAAIGSGGLFGKGFTQGTQTQMAFIPEQSTDFVFTIIGEEFGFIGAMVMLTLFGLLIIRIAGLGVSAGFAFPRLFAAGVTGIFLVHILINIGMTIGLIPVIGIPLPLISYGGSALLANTAMVALALNLHARRDEFAIYTG